MSVRHGGTLRPRARRHVAAVAGLLALSVVTAACSTDGTPDRSGSRPGSAKPADAASAPTSAAPAASAVSFTTNVAKKRGVKVDKVVKLTAADGTFSQVTVRAGKGDDRLDGTLSGDRTTWTSTEALEPDTRYRVVAVAEDADGVRATKRSSFRTEHLSLDQQTFPSFAPLGGETVGVGMPVIVRFDVPVTDKASIERHLTVTNTSNQQGAWHWISDSEVHWRPKTYWKPGTDVTVKADINSVPAGNGVYGQVSRSTSFHVGDSVISKVNVLTHRMKVFVNGRLMRTIPVSAGKPGFITRSGIKVIVEKFRHKRMDAATTGISKDSPEYYNLSNVEYAMRVTYSGEFIHAAPWSVGSQGSANVSHGCVGMSTENAAWLYSISKRGDVVDVTGSDRHMTLDNGYGDWNDTFAQYRQGSALS
jgi:lipoprotein-anchoring transpeptidase ErfK/SrfK